MSYVKIDNVAYKIKDFDNRRSSTHSYSGCPYGIYTIPDNEEIATGAYDIVTWYRSGDSLNKSYEATGDQALLKQVLTGASVNIYDLKITSTIHFNRGTKQIASLEACHMLSYDRDTLTLPQEPSTEELEQQAQEIIDTITNTKPKPKELL